ncbi:polysaccharide pyruvyl transferase family protein [Nesterenkonia rhizosphaerae]|uniref:Polysaccharide pyruvyl transferase domain-containing protein n=1 Tax=Nesterenkonia rhizosphaerae TaxID=1348272 RepID=A0ABP9FVM6_9MICC
MTSRTPKVQLLGYFGWGNFGDDLFREVCEENAGLLWPGAEVRAFERPRQNFSHPRPDAALRRLVSAARGAAWADTFVYAGGSVFSEVAGLARLRRHLPNRSYEALGVSVGPFANSANHRAVVSELRRFDRVVVRDQESFDRMEGYGVLGGDLAALSSRLGPAQGPRSGLVICPSSAAGMSGNELADAVSSALGSADPEITLLALHAHPRLGDHALATRIAGQLRREGRSVQVVDYGAVGIAGVVGILSRASLVWSQRLHGAIVSYLLGTPVAIVDHHEKCAAFARDIGIAPPFVAPRFSELSGTLSALGTGSMHHQRVRHPWGRSAEDYRARAWAAYAGVKASKEPK